MAKENNDSLTSLDKTIEALNDPGTILPIVRSYAKLYAEIRGKEELNLSGEDIRKLIEAFNNALTHNPQLEGNINPAVENLRKLLGE